MAVGKDREGAITRADVSSSNNSNNTKLKVPIVMTSLKTNTIKRGNFSENRDVKKLTDLMERFHTLSGFYETKRKSFYREKTFPARSLTPIKNTSEISTRENIVIPKPIPALAQIKSKKNGQKKSSASMKPTLKDSDKVSETLQAKLHSGKGIGVSVFRLKDSLSEENVLHSVPQEDIKYSFHQPPPFPRNESSLYHEALASSHKYIIANGGKESRKIGVMRQHTFTADRSDEKSTIDIAKDIRSNLNKAIVHNTTSQNKGMWIGDTVKANTIADFNLARKKPSKQKSFSHEQQQAGIRPSVVFTKEKFDSVKSLKSENIQDKISETSKLQKKVVLPVVESISDSQSNKDQMRLEKLPSNVAIKSKKRPRRHVSVRSPPTATVVDMSPRQSIDDKLVNDKDKFDKKLKPIQIKHSPQSDKEITDKSTHVEEAPVIKMPRFVRPVEEIDSYNAQSKSVSSIRPDLISANSYYTTTYPKRRGTPLSSVRSTTGTDVSKSTPELVLSPPPPSVRSASHVQVLSPLSSHFISPPPPTPNSRRPSPIKKTPETDPRQYSYASARKDLGKPKEGHRHRKPMTGRHGGIKKLITENKDLKLDTGVQGHSCVPNATEENIVVTNEEENKEKSLKGGKTDKKVDKKDREPASKADNIELKDKNNNLAQEPVFNANESFVIKSKQPFQERNNSELVNSAITSKPHQKYTGKLAPLMSLKREMQRSKFILARTSGIIDTTNQSPVHLVSDPVTFSVRHPSYTGPIMPLIDEEKPQFSYDGDDSQNENVNEIVSNHENDSKEITFHKFNGIHQSKTDADRTVVVFFHHSQVPQELSREAVSQTYPRYGALNKSSHKTTKSPILEQDETDGQKEASGKEQTKKTAAILRRGSKVETSEITKKKNEKGFKKKKKDETVGSTNIPPQLQHVNIKTTGGGGFKANAAHYSMLFRQQQQMKQDRDTFLRLMRDDLLLPERNQEMNFTHRPPKQKVKNSISVSEFREATIETDPVKFATMLKKFNSMHRATNKKPTTYTMFSSGYPIKQEDAFEHVVQTHHPSDLPKKQSEIKLHYLWPDPKRRSFPIGSISKPTVKSVKSHSSNNSDTSSTKSLTITDLNFELKSNEKHLRSVVPNLAQTSIPNKFHDTLIANNSLVLRHPHKSGYAIFTLPEVPTVDISEFEQTHSVNLENTECDELLNSILKNNLQ
ncbi:uncharacterized protein LOC144432414 [Styela clava]